MVFKFVLDSSPHLLDNLHSSFEQKGLDPQRSRINHKVEDDQELNLNSPSTEKNTLTSSSNSTSAATGTSAVILAPRLKSDILETSLPKTLTSVRLYSKNLFIFMFSRNAETERECQISAVSYWYWSLRNLREDKGLKSVFFSDLSIFSWADSIGVQ